MKRSIKKQIWMNKKEAEDLKKKAKNACMTESRYIRMLIASFIPREAPDDRFFADMDKLRELGDELSRKAGTHSEEATSILEDEAKSLHLLQAKIEREYLRPDKVDKRWQ